MSQPARIAELRNHYIQLSKSFFEQIADGKDPADLQLLQEEIERTLLQLDALERESPGEEPGT